MKTLEVLRQMFYATWVLAGLLRVLWLWQFRKAGVVPGYVAKWSLINTALVATIGATAWASVVHYRIADEQQVGWVVAYTAAIGTLAVMLVVEVVTDYLHCSRRRDKDDSE